MLNSPPPPTHTHRHTRAHRQTHVRAHTRTYTHARTHTQTQNFSHLQATIERPHLHDATYAKVHQNWISPTKFEFKYSMQVYKKFTKLDYEHLAQIHNNDSL